MTIHDFGMPLSYSDELERPKADIREENDRLIAAFLARGGHIQQVARGVSGLQLEELTPKELLRLPAWKRVEWYKRRAILADQPIDIELHDEHVARVEAVEAEQEAVKEVASELH